MPESFEELVLVVGVVVTVTASADVLVGALEPVAATDGAAPLLISGSGPGDVARLKPYAGCRRLKSALLIDPS